MKHGRYSLKKFDGVIHDNDLALTILTNHLEQFSPITPTAVSLVHQPIHQQLRFLQMEYLFNQAVSLRVIDILAKPVTLLPAIMRELDRLPARIERTLKLLRAEIKLREENVEIEPIPDPAPLPLRPKQDVYEAVVTPDGLIPKTVSQNISKKR